MKGLFGTSSRQRLRIRLTEATAIRQIVDSTISRRLAMSSLRLSLFDLSWDTKVEVIRKGPQL